MKQLFILLFISTIGFCKSTKTFREQLIALFPKAKVEAIKTKDHFIEAYEVVLDQFLDPKNPSKGTFKHHLYISHSSDLKPTILVTDGYNSNNRTTELARLFKGNQIIVEYRFYGKSRPNPIPWEYLTNDNAIEDYHGIVTKLKKIYKGKWIASGISKGGETALIYKAKYPNDVDVTVPYVAPLINTQEDVRTNNLINSVGEKSCRDNIRNYQRMLLKNKKEILSLLAVHVKEKKLQFTELSEEEALEYAVLEFPFSFWQWGGKCKEVPKAQATVKEQFEYLAKVVGFYIYSDAGFTAYLPSFYQHMIELGYYGFDLEPVKDLLKIVKTATNKRFAPKNVDLTYNVEYIKKVRDYIENKGNNILYIYGAYDPWGACAPNPKPTVDALKKVLEKGSHAVRIRNFSTKDKQKIYKKLQEWLGKNVEMYPI